VVASQNRPWKVPGTGRRSGFDPTLSRRPRESRLALRGGTENAGTPEILRFHRCTGQLNATQPGVLAVSTRYIRGLGAPCKGSVTDLQHSSLFTGSRLKESLILRFYCVKRAARRHGIGGEPPKS
jgi:hypothetical protein